MNHKMETALCYLASCNPSSWLKQLLWSSTSITPFPVQSPVSHLSNAPGVTNDCSSLSRNVRPVSHLDAGLLHPFALLQPLPTIRQLTSHPCTLLHPGAARLVIYTGPSPQSGVQEVGSPVCGPIPHLKGHQPCSCLSSSTMVHEDPSHLPCL